MTTLILSHTTALSYWNERDDALRCKPLSLERGHAALAQTGRASSLDVARALDAYPQLARLPRPVELLVGEHAAHRRRAYATFRTWQSGLPAHSLVEIGKGAGVRSESGGRLYASTSEFIFLQMARELNGVELALLGYELCGAYSSKDVSKQRPPLTTPTRLSAFLEKARGAHGSARALKALRGLAAGSRSPRESQIALLACLPRPDGGFGLRTPKLNVPIELDAGGKSVLHQERIVPDLYWPDAQIAVEYDSQSFHAGEGPSEHDARKRMVYHLMGIEVLSITNGQFKDFSAMVKILEGLAKRLGQRQRPANAKMRARQMAVHKALLRATDAPAVQGVQE